jgi:hypothetical protein
MNKKEARTILSQIMSKYQQKDYSFWKNSITDSPIVATRKGLTGVSYQI